jgi:autotransporter-associated beta strand protein
MGIINLCSGTLIADYVQNTSPGIALLNFNGGVLKASTTSTTFLPTSLTGVYVNGPLGAYAGGAMIDSAGRDITCVAPLRAPTGNGVTAISLSSQGSGYIGEPYVSIAGDGIGATAVANMVDDGTGNGTYKVASVTITTPGVNYTTATVSFLKGGATAVAPAVGSVSVTPNISGGLTKLGSGVLTLSGANTYAGATTISNGTLRLGIANALPTNNAVQVDGGIYDLNSFTVTNGALNTTSGSIVNGRLNSTGINKDGDGRVMFMAVQTEPSPVIINKGTFSLGGVAAGLFEGRVAGNQNWTAPNPQTTNQLSTRYANMYFANAVASGGIWPDNTTYIYTGYLWNDATTNETWSFMRVFDDSTMITLNGETILYNTQSGAIVSSNAVVRPGANTFELRLAQGGGGVGNNGGAWPNMGIGYDRMGRNQLVYANYKTLTDPGDGSLLTLFEDPYAADSLPRRSGKLADASTVDLVAPDTLLDLGTTAQTLAELSGSGTVSNGALSVTVAISPAGTNVVGTLTSKGDTTLSGKLIVDVATNRTSDCDRLVVEGLLTLTSAKLEIRNPQNLSTLQVYTLATYTETAEIPDALALPENLSNSLWTVRQTNTKIQLYYQGGTIIMFN